MAKRDLQSGLNAKVAETVNLTVVGDVGNKVTVATVHDTEGFALGFVQLLEYSRTIIDPTDDVKFLYEISDDNATWVEVDEGILPTSTPYAVEPASGEQQVIGLGGHEAKYVRLILDVVALSGDVDIVITTVMESEVQFGVEESELP